MDRAGLVGPDGPTHHGIFDISMLNSLPNIIITAPKDGNELFDLIYTGINSNKPFSIRYPKGNCDVYNHDSHPLLIDIGKWEYLSKGKNVALLGVGSMIKTCMKIKANIEDYLNEKITIINARFVKPMDKNMLNEISKNHKTIFTFEEGSEIGGFGSSVLNYFSKIKDPPKIYIKGIQDSYIEQGTREELLEITGLDKNSILNFIINKIKNNEKN